MDIPVNGGARLPEDIVVDTRYIYMLALALVGLRWQLARSYFRRSIFKGGKLSGCRACDEDHSAPNALLLYCDCTVPPGRCTS
jgi:hypothetical protein